MERDGKRWKEMERDGKRWKEMERDGKRWKEMEKEMDGSKSIGKFIQLALPPYAMPMLPSAQCSTSLLETSPLANSVSHHELNVRAFSGTKTYKDARIRSTSFKGFLVPSAASKQDALLIPGSFFDSGCSTAAPHRETSGNLPGTALSQAPRDEEMRLHLKKHIIHTYKNKQINQWINNN